MPLGFTVGKATLISPWDDREPLNVHLPGVHPGRYTIPSVSSPDEVFAMCRIGIRTMVSQQEELQQYARKVFLKPMEGVDARPLVVLTVFDAFTPMHGTGKQVRDEFGQHMYPDVSRAMIPVPAPQVANDIEGQYGHLGIRTIQGDEPTLADAKAAWETLLVYKQNEIAETNKQFHRWGPRAVNPQRQRIAWDLHKLGLLTPLPVWASVNPDAKPHERQNCRICGTMLPSNPIKCPACPAIYDWDVALEYGVVTPEQYQARLERQKAKAAAEPLRDEGVPAGEPVKLESAPPPVEGSATVDEVAAMT